MQPVKVSRNVCYLSANVSAHGCGNPQDRSSTHLLGMQPVKVSGNVCNVSANVP